MVTSEHWSDIGFLCAHRSHVVTMLSHTMSAKAEDTWVGVKDSLAKILCSEPGSIPPLFSDS